MINIPIQQYQTKVEKKEEKRELSKGQLFEASFKRITLDNVCEAIEHGQLVAPAIVSYLVGPNVFKYLGKELQELLVRNVQVIVRKNKLTMSILDNS